MNKSCKNCQQNFEITDEDLKFYGKVSPEFKGKKYLIPTPNLCPDCRRQRRFAFRNERNLYKRKCDLSGKQIVSVYSPDKAYKVYGHDEWWSDQWEALEYGQDYNFEKTFFEQYEELHNKVPRMNMIVVNSENSDYAPYSVNSKNCYMCVSCNYSEDVYYSYQVNFSRNCIDSMLCNNCELCYESLYGTNLYHCLWTTNCKESSDLFFCRDCQGCQKCIGCVNLRNKTLYVFNKQVTEEEYLSMVKLLNNGKNIEKMKQDFQAISVRLPYRENHNINCENASGDNLRDCKNCSYCFDAGNLEDCKYVYVLPKGGKDIYDSHYSQNSELVYDSVSAVNDYQCSFVIHAWDIKNSMYCDECYYSDNLFGCIGLRNKKYCILNKQYSKEDYEKLVPLIIENMIKTKEFGEFFPIQSSHFGYTGISAEASGRDLSVCWS